MTRYWKLYSHQTKITSEQVEAYYAIFETWALACGYLRIWFPGYLTEIWDNPRLYPRTLRLTYHIEAICCCWQRRENQYCQMQNGPRHICDISLLCVRIDPPFPSHLPFAQVSWFSVIKRGKNQFPVWTIAFRMYGFNMSCLRNFIHKNLQSCASLQNLSRPCCCTFPSLSTTHWRGQRQICCAVCVIKNLKLNLQLFATGWSIAKFCSLCKVL